MPEDGNSSELSGAAPSADGTRRLVLRDANVVDGDGARPHSTVVVEDRRITAVRSPADAVVATGPRDRVVDLGGRTVMPAMVSSHFHATYHELGSNGAAFEPSSW